MRLTLFYLPITNPRILNSAKRVSTYRNQSTARIRPTSCNLKNNDCHDIRTWYSSCANCESNSYKAEVLRQVRTVNYVDEWDIHILKQVQTDWGYVHTIDLFNDTAAIFSLLDLRSVMGCPGGTRSVFTRAFRARRELDCVFLGQKGNHYYIQTRHNDLFFPLKSFYRKSEYIGSCSCLLGIP